MSKHKKTKNILIAFLLNFTFSIAEFFGGLLTNSTAIMSDSIHDMGDALSIGISYILERKSEGKPDKNYTYGYSRYSMLGAAITSLILLIGSIFIIINAIHKICNPVTINYDGMILLAIAGTFVNLIAVIKTSGGSSLNEKAVNLHMLEDALGWIIVLIGGIVMKFTGLSVIDPILSIVVSTFILMNVLKNLKEIMNIFLIKVPDKIDIKQLEEELEAISEEIHIHHLHIWKLDENNICGSVHIVSNGDLEEIKKNVREVCNKNGINHMTIEIGKEEVDCELIKEDHYGHCCHHHHH